jgi:hypothetical protein
MLVSAIVTATDAAPGFAPTGILRSLLFTMIGLDVGLRFSRRTVWSLRRILPGALACILAISTACGALAWTLSAFTRIPFADAYLATTPGGINAVLATASSSHANLSLISSVQSLRLFEMAFLAPLLIRLTVRRSRSAGRSSGRFRPSYPSCPEGLRPVIMHHPAGFATRALPPPELQGSRPLRGSE